ncbi:MAG TPA: hypothetical protein VFG68_08780 [Fimbriiglobus sp.]|nr:hypothetical protein [Fimbriiglobus sp.]
MPTLCFPNPDALRLALASGIVPPEAARQPVRGAADAHGRTWADVPDGFPKDALAALARIGVTLHGPGTGPPTRDLSQWAELLPLRPNPAAPSGPALIEVRDDDLARLTADLRRLGSPPLSVRLVPDGDRAWLTVRAVPVFTALSLAGDGSRAEVYVPQAPGVWVLSGWEHPLGANLAPPDGTTALLHPGREWRTVPDTPATPEPEAYSLPTREPRWRPDPLVPEPFPVGLSLRPVAGASGHETLWILPGEPADRLGELARDNGERILHEFRAAVLRGPEFATRTALIAVGRQVRPPALPPRVRGMVPHGELLTLYLPTGFGFAPSVRTRSLAHLLDVSPDVSVWVEPGPAGGFTVHRSPVSAFRPLGDLIRYGAPTARELSIVRATSGLLAVPRFVAEPDTQTAAVSHPVTTRAPAANPQARHGSTTGRWLDRIKGRLFGGKSGPIRSVKRVRADSPPVPTQPVGWAREKLASPRALLLDSDWSARRGALEQRVLTELPRRAPPDRAGLWVELAEVYAALGNHADAAVCWLNAAWDGGPATPSVLGNWLRAEARAARVDRDASDLGAVLGLLTPAQAARVTAAHLVWAAAQPAPPAGMMSHLPRALALLKDHEANVPARAVWLARSAAARLTGGDPLALARCRDRLFRRLTEKGPGLDLDAPSFLRFRGSTASDRWLTARDWLARVRDPVHRWFGRLAGPGRLQWAGIDPEANCTSAYADLILAWGLSRLGDRARARDLEAHADAVLRRAGGDAAEATVHRILRAAFGERIRSAEDGRPDRPGLPLEAAAELARLDDLGRYAVDKLRAHCGVLEPVDLVNPYRGRDLGGFLGADPLGDRLARLLARPDLAPDPAEGRALLAAAGADPTATTLPRVVFALLEVGPRLDPETAAGAIVLTAQAVELIPEWVRLSGSALDPAAAVRRFGSRLIAAAAHSAGLFHLPESFRRVAAAVRAAADTPDAPAVQVVERTAGLFFRTLRRLGLTAPAAELLAALADGATVGPRELGLAVGWFAIGDEDAGMRVLDAARERLFVPGIPDERERTAIAIAYAVAAGHAPPRIALARLEELFLRLGGVTAHGATNRYFTLKPLELIDTVVRAVVSDDFALGPGVRGWLDDDEYLIRRRITRDLESAMS